MDELLTMLPLHQPVSGEALCQQLGMTRGAVWKRMEKLRQEGYQISACGKLGYRLEPVENSLLPGYIYQEVGTHWAGRGEICHAQEMTSTNTRAKEMARAGAPAGSLAICEAQTAGRGRLQRSWETLPGQALTQSLVLRPRLAVEQAQLCTLAAAIAAAKAIQEICPILSPGIKWPNDIVLGSKKCVGILCELAADMDGIVYVVAGTGINVNQLSFPPELTEKATSLLLEMRQSDPDAAPICRRRLLCAYLRHMEKAMEALEKEGFAGIQEDYLPLSVTLGRTVQVISPEETFVGQAQSIDETGALMVMDESGALRRILCGDVSVRGLMGYC